MVHLMLDLETWGTLPGSALRSIGACIFNPNGGDIGNEFYANIDRLSCGVAGLLVDPRTEQWWSEQSPEAQTALEVDPKPIAMVVERFSAFCSAARVEYVWSQGSNFDSVLWEAACRGCGRQAPWKFYNTRDTRTAYDMAGLDTRTIQRVGTHHNALEDARHQARCVQAAYARITRKEL